MKMDLQTVSCILFPCGLYLVTFSSVNKSITVSSLVQRYSQSATNMPFRIGCRSSIRSFQLVDAIMKAALILRNVSHSEEHVGYRERDVGGGKGVV